MVGLRCIEGALSSVLRLRAANSKAHDQAPPCPGGLVLCVCSFQHSDSLGNQIELCNLTLLRRTWAHLVRNVLRF